MITYIIDVAVWVSVFGLLMWSHSRRMKAIAASFSDRIEHLETEVAVLIVGDFIRHFGVLSKK